MRVKSELQPGQAARVGTTVRKAEPDRVWQSVQWQITTVAGSTSASKLTWPQWQLPSIFTLHTFP